MDGLELLRLRPIFQPRVWGGNRLQPDSGDRVGEAWVVYEGNEVDGGTWSGHLLSEVAESVGAELLGGPVVERTGDRFPLLIKLLDSQGWLSVQVHPDDEQAARLEGPGNFGKTEAWHVLEADEDARVVFGLLDEPSSDRLRDLAQQGSFEGALKYLPVVSGETLFTPAGTVHAIGPGMFIYEVQQTSDITYRLFDWNRPLTDGRELHLDKGLQVIQASGGDRSRGRWRHEDPRRDVVVECDYFVLESVTLPDDALTMSTGNTSFHAVTVTRGEAEISTYGSSTRLSAWDTVLVPAALDEYVITPATGCSALIAYVPASPGG